MKSPKIIILIIIILLIADVVYEGVITPYLKSFEKYIKIGLIILIGIGLIVMLEKKPNTSKDVVKSVNDLITVFPVTSSKNTIKNITELYNQSQHVKKVLINESVKSVEPEQYPIYDKPQSMPSDRKPLNKIHKRSVSDAKKKYVAASQEWRCADCNQILAASFEVDHKIELQDGGTNDIENLAALCRNCHGSKTYKNRMFKND